MLDDVRGPFRALLDGQRSPQQTAEIICAEALGRDNGQWPWLWLLWAALSAPCASGQRETERAEEDMRRAAQEWLALSSDELEWRPYFDRWLGRTLRWQPAVTKPLRGVSAPATENPRLRRRPKIEIQKRQSQRRGDCA